MQGTILTDVENSAASDDAAEDSSLIVADNGRLLEKAEEDISTAPDSDVETTEDAETIDTDIPGNNLPHPDLSNEVAELADADVPKSSDDDNQLQRHARLQ